MTVCTFLVNGVITPFKGLQTFNSMERNHHCPIEAASTFAVKAHQRLVDVIVDPTSVLTELGLTGHHRCLVQISFWVPPKPRVFRTAGLNGHGRNIMKGGDMYWPFDAQCRAAHRKVPDRRSNRIRSSGVSQSAPANPDRTPLDHVAVTNEELSSFWLRKDGEKSNIS